VTAIFRIAGVRSHVTRRTHCYLRTRIIAFAAALTTAMPFAGKSAFSSEVGAEGFEYKIFPGNSIGPVTIGATVHEVISKLGRPSRKLRDTYRDQNISADLITLIYRQHCISFSFYDSGVRPKIENAKLTKTTDTPPKFLLSDRHLAIKVTCPLWQTADGLHVGSTIKEVLEKLGTPDIDLNCNSDRPECTLVYQEGIWFRTRNRHSPVFEIGVLNSPH